jgi:hypothetical protein
VACFNDDGTPMAADLFPKPTLCVSCAKDSDPSKTNLCTLTRGDQQGEEVFVCFAYRPISPAVQREAVLRDLCEQAGIPYADEGWDDDAIVTL